MQLRQKELFELRGIDPKVCFPVVIGTKSNDVSWGVGALLGQADHMVRLDESDAILRQESDLPAMFAPASCPAHHIGTDFRIPFEVGAYLLGAIRSNRTFWLVDEVINGVLLHNGLA